MKKTICYLTLLVILLLSASTFAQSDTTNDTWRMEGNTTLTDNTAIITKNLGIGAANKEYEDGLHLIDKPLIIQRTNSPKWRLYSSSSPTGPFWIQNITGNVNALRIESNGRFGIGTGASIVPEAQLHVKSYNHKALYVQGGNSQGNHAIFQTGSSVGEPIFSIFNDHQLGINTTVPTATLEIGSFDVEQIQDYSGLKVTGSFENNAAQIINDHSGANAGGLTIETTDSNAQGNALLVKTNRVGSPMTMFRIPNFQANNNSVIIAEDGGKVGIGTANPQKALDVCGHIRAKEIIVESEWCDYVFLKNYNVPSLQNQALFIKENGHLINFDSAKEMDGYIEVADVTTRQQKTIEEMMIYLIEMEDKVNKLTSTIEVLEAKLNLLK